MQWQPIERVVNVTLIWDLAKYDEDLARLEAAEDHDERVRLSEMMLKNKCSTTYVGFPLTDAQDRVVKFFDLNRSNEHHHQVLRQLLHEVVTKLFQDIGGRQPVCYELSWREGRDRLKRLRYAVYRDRDRKTNPIQRALQEET